MDPKEIFDLMARFSSEIRKLTLKRLEEVPDGFMNWRLNNTAMSFADIVQHLIDVDELFFSLITTDKRTFRWALGSEEPHLQIDAPTYDVMLKRLKEFQIRRHAVISTLDDAMIKEQLTDENGEKMTFWWFLMNKVLEHEAYHRGQIAAYLKVLKGESPES